MNGLCEYVYNVLGSLICLSLTFRIVCTGFCYWRTWCSYVLYPCIYCAQDPVTDEDSVLHYTHVFTVCRILSLCSIVYMFLLCAGFCHCVALYTCFCCVQDSVFVEHCTHVFTVCRILSLLNIVRMFLLCTGFCHCWTLYPCFCCVQDPVTV